MQVIQEKLAKLEKIQKFGPSTSGSKKADAKKHGHDQRASSDAKSRDANRRSPDRLGVRGAGSDKGKQTASRQDERPFAAGKKVEQKKSDAKSSVQASPFAERMRSAEAAQRKSRFDTDASGKSMVTQTKPGVQPLMSVQPAGRSDAKNVKGDVDHRRPGASMHSSQDQTRTKGGAKGAGAKGSSGSKNEFDEKRFYDDHDYRQKSGKPNTDLDFRHRDYDEGRQSARGGGDRKRSSDNQVSLDSKRMRASDESQQRGGSRRGDDGPSPRRNQGQLNKELSKTNQMRSSSSVSIILWSVAVVVCIHPRYGTRSSRWPHTV